MSKHQQQNSPKTTGPAASSGAPQQRQPGAQTSPQPGQVPTPPGPYGSNYTAQSQAKPAVTYDAMHAHQSFKAKYLNGNTTWEQMAALKKELDEGQRQGKDPASLRVLRESLKKLTEEWLAKRVGKGDEPAKYQLAEDLLRELGGVPPSRGTLGAMDLSIVSAAQQQASSSSSSSAAAAAAASKAPETDRKLGEMAAKLGVDKELTLEWFDPAGKVAKRMGRLGTSVPPEDLKSVQDEFIRQNSPAVGFTRPPTEVKNIIVKPQHVQAVTAVLTDVQKAARQTVDPALQAQIIQQHSNLWAAYRVKEAAMRTKDNVLPPETTLKRWLSEVGGNAEKSLLTQLIAAVDQTPVTTPGLATVTTLKEWTDLNLKHLI